MKNNDAARSSIWLNRYALENLINAIRTARCVFRSDEACTSIKYKVATDVRTMTREARDAGIISFDCCEALQRALDY